MHSEMVTARRAYLSWVPRFGTPSRGRRGCKLNGIGANKRRPRLGVPNRGTRHSLNRLKQPRIRRAFSLIEFTVVLALMGLIAGVVTLNVRHHMVKGKQNAVRSEIAVVRDAIETFYTTMGRYPTNEEGLAILTKTSERISEPLLPRVPTDPWSHPYQYNQPGKSEPYEVISLGADGREGGSGGDADISSSDLKANTGG